MDTIYALTVDVAEEFDPSAAAAAAAAYHHYCYRRRPPSRVTFLYRHWNEWQPQQKSLSNARTIASQISLGAMTTTTEGSIQSDAHSIASLISFASNVSGCEVLVYGQLDRGFTWHEKHMSKHNRALMADKLSGFAHMFSIGRCLRFAEGI
ncbi:hypothetical protein LSAT2_001162 [Lamellibrachia satsuma]|nr:hypothetical protein LSAT2_001162 [Lamellibrachia satsuma]